MSGWELLAFAGIATLMVFGFSLLLWLGKDPWRAIRRDGQALAPATARRAGGLGMLIAVGTLAIFTALAFGLIPTDGIVPIGAGR